MPTHRLSSPISALLFLIGLVLSNPGHGAAQPTSEGAFALVIGNSDYDRAPLKNPENDANAMARALVAVGFKVEKLTNATRTEIEKAIIRFGRRLKKSRTLGLFYYAGHAVQLGGRNYLIPLGASIEAVEEVRVESVDLEYVLARMDAAANPMNILILDACRDNPFGFNSVTAPSGLAPVDAPSGSFIAYATAPGKVAADGNGDNGLYTSQLISAMKLPGVKIEDVFKRVRREVAKQTNGFQVPWESSSLTADFYFRSPEATPGPSPQSRPTGAEITYWESIRASANPDMFHAYLSQYPNGTYSGLAKARLEELKAPKTVTAAHPPMDFQITPLDQQMIAVKTANIRSQPTVNSPKVGSLILGTPVTVTGEALVGGLPWYRVERPERSSGFVYAPLLGEKGVTWFLLRMGPETLAILLVAVTFGLLLLGFPVAFTFGATAIAFALVGTALDLFDPRLLSNIPSRFLDIMTDDVLVAVPLFVFMGLMLVRSGLDGQLLVILKSLLGRVHGGLALSVVFAGVVLAAITGFAGTALGAMGLLFLPLMLKAGYDNRLASGVALASGSFGQIVPPSITLVLLGGILQIANTDSQRLTGNWDVEPVSVADLFAGVVFPGLLLVGLYSGWIIVKALITPKACPPLSALQATSATPLRLVIQSLVAPSVLLVTVVGSILTGIASPAEAAGLGAIGAILLAGREKRRNPKARPAPPHVGTAAGKTDEAGRQGEIRIESLFEGFAGLLPRWSRSRGVKPSKQTAPADQAAAPASISTPPEGFTLGGNWIPLAAGLSLLGLMLLATFYEIRLPREIFLGQDLAAFMAACMGVVVLTWGLVACLRRVLLTGALVEAMRQTVNVSSMVFVTLLGASVFVLVFRGYGGDDLMARLLANVPGGPPGAMLAVIVATFILGFYLDFLSILVVFVPIAAPVVFQMGVDPLWFGVMIAVTLQTNFITPPLGFALSCLRALAPNRSGPNGALRGVLPFVIIQLVGLALIAVFPVLATWLPALLRD